ncbi:MAG: hypothetical protein VX901_09580 [Candidatus Poribacteria bacterium]|nr:hypothetical protein [Candidatus Poribacteria bacterium]
MKRKTKTTNFDDTKLLDIAMKDDKFSSLWFGDWESNSDSFNTDYPTQFVAELALCKKLAFYWGKDFDAIDRMFQRSGLYCGKWDEQKHKNRTIKQAIKDTEFTYQDGL